MNRADTVLEPGAPLAFTVLLLIVYIAYIICGKRLFYDQKDRSSSGFEESDE